MRMTISKTDREGLLSCCGRQPFVRAFVDFEDEFHRQFDIACPVCSRKVCCDTFSLAKSQWNLEVDFSNLSDAVRSLDNEGNS